MSDNKEGSKSYGESESAKRPVPVHSSSLDAREAHAARTERTKQRRVQRGEAMLTVVVLRYKLLVYCSRELADCKLCGLHKKTKRAVGLERYKVRMRAPAPMA